VDGVAHFFEALGDENGEPSASGNEPYRGRGWGGVGQDGEFTGHGLYGFYQQSDVACEKGWPWQRFAAASKGLCGGGTIEGV